MLVVSILGTCLSFLLVPVLGPVVMSIIGFIEGVIYLTKSDDEFYHRYAIQKVAWF